MLVRGQTRCRTDSVRIYLAAQADRLEKGRENRGISLRRLRFAVGLRAAFGEYLPGGDLGPQTMEKLVVYVGKFCS